MRRRRCGSGTATGPGPPADPAAVHRPVLPRPADPRPRRAGAHLHRPARPGDEARRHGPRQAGLGGAAPRHRQAAAPQGGPRQARQARRRRMGADAPASPARPGARGPLVSWLGEWAGGISDHHENFDGSGYPEGKAGRGDRPRRPHDPGGRHLRRDDQCALLQEAGLPRGGPAGTGRRLGPLLRSERGAAFLRIGLGRLRWTAGPLSWLAQTPILRALEVVRELGTAAAAAGAATVGAAALGVNLMLPPGPMRPCRRRRRSPTT